MKRVWVYEHLSGGCAAPGDALRAAGLAMRDAMLADLLDSGDYQVAAATGAHAAPLPAGVLAVRPRPGEDAFDFVAREAALHDLVWLVAPETDGLLARFEQVVGSARWLGCEGRAIAIASSKRATLARLAAHGVTTPLALDRSPEVQRWVVKPDDGAGALATQRHTRFDAALADLSQRTSPATLEPWVDGEALSLSLLCDDEKTELLAVNRQHLTIETDGAVRYAGVDSAAIPLHDARSAECEQLAQRVSEALPGLRGFVGIDIVWHARRGPVLIEVNPRLTCAYVGLSAKLGRNLAAETIACQARSAVSTDA